MCVVCGFIGSGDLQLNLDKPDDGLYWPKHVVFFVDLIRTTH